MSGKVTDRQTNGHDKQKREGNIFPPPHCQTTAFSSPPYMPHALPISSWIDYPICEVYKSCSSKLCIFLQPSVTYSLTCPTVCQHPALEHRLYCSLNVRPTFTPIQKQQEQLQFFFLTKRDSRWEDRFLDCMVAGIPET